MACSRFLFPPPAPASGSGDPFLLSLEDWLRFDRAVRVLWGADTVVGCFTVLPRAILSLSLAVSALCVFAVEVFSLEIKGGVCDFSAGGHAESLTHVRCPGLLFHQS